MDYKHIPVLEKEIATIFEKVLTPKSIYVDATVGGGGHLVHALNLGINAIAFDQDQDSIKHLSEKLATQGFKLDDKQADFSKFIKDSQYVYLVNSNFVNLDTYLAKFQIKEVSCILFDLGMSSYHIDSSGRGFSFMRNEVLDMRMDKNLQVTAMDLVNGLGVKELTFLFKKLGEERFSKQIASEIVKTRKLKKITTAEELRGIAERMNKSANNKIHPATRIFQALRIAVNDEINSFQIVLPKAASVISKKGVILCITFHSLEEKVLKDFILKRSDLDIIGKVITPSLAEVRKNRRSRSAKLFILGKNAK